MKKNQIKTEFKLSAWLVRIEFIHATADKISIIGTYNAWRLDATPMTRVSNGRWCEELLLPPGVYEYQLVADGKWIPDPPIPQSAPNPLGEANSRLTVAK